MRGYGSFDKLGRRQFRSEAPNGSHELQSYDGAVGVGQRDSDRVKETLDNALEPARNRSRIGVNSSGHPR